MKKTDLYTKTDNNHLELYLASSYLQNIKIHGYTIFKSSFYPL